MNPGLEQTGSGEPVVLLHSSMSSKAQWGRLAANLSLRYSVLAIDLHGYGDQAMPADPARFSLDDEVGLVLDHVRRAAGPLRHFHLVGHSYGGAVALRIAQLYPSRLSSLTVFEPVAVNLLDPAEPVLNSFVAAGLIVTKLVQGGRHREAAAAFIDFWNGPGTYAALPAEAQQSFAAMAPKAALDFRALLATTSRLADLASLALPCCLIGGIAGPDVTRRILTLLSETITGSQTHSVAGGHMAPVNSHRQVNPVIRSFIARHATERLQIAA